jgi:hypothetical protein
MQATVGMYGDLQGIVSRTLQEIEGLEFQGCWISRERIRNGGPNVNTTGASARNRQDDGALQLLTRTNPGLVATEVA